MIEAVLALAILFTFLLNIQQSMIPSTQQPSNDNRLFSITDSTLSALYNNNNIRYSAANDSLDTSDITDFISQDVGYSFGLFGKKTEATPDDDTVLLYHFNEGTGTKVGDDSAQENNGAITGATFTTGKYNKALFFNGVDDYVTVSGDLDFPSSSFSICAWVKSIDNSGERAIVSRGYKTYELKQRSGYWKFRSTLVNTASNAIVGGPVETGVWTHLCAVYDKDNSMVYLYENGVEVNSSSSASYTSESGNTAVGARKAGSYQGMYFNGTIDEVLIYKRALTSSEVKEIYSPSEHVQTDSLVVGETPKNKAMATYHFNKKDGLLVHDSGYGHNNGLMMNGPQYVSGKFGNALSFDGVDDYVNCSDIMAGFENFSISAWIKTNQSEISSHRYNDPAIIGTKQGYGDSNDFVLTNYNGNLAWFDELGTGEHSYDTGTFIADGTWHHVAVTRSGSSLEFYVDGTNVGSDTTGTDLVRDDDIEIGRALWSGSLYLNGSIDEVNIYKRALSASEIRQNYNKGMLSNISTTTPSITSSRVIAGWRDELGGRYRNTFYGDAPTVEPITPTEHNILVAHFDETGGNNALDSSRNNHNGIITSATRTSGRFGPALKFDGVDDLVSFGDFGSQDSVTISMYAKFDKWTNDTSAARALFDTREDVSGTNSKDGVRIENYDNTLKIWIGDTSNNAGTDTTLTSSDVVGKWNNFLITYTRSTKAYAFYFNGELKASGTSTYQPSTSWFSNFVVGVGYERDNSIIRYFNGSIDDVAIWNRTLSAQEIKLIAQDPDVSFVDNKDYNRVIAGKPIQSDDYTQLLYNFDDHNSTTVFDSSSNSLDGTLENGASIENISRFGKGISLDGSDDYVQSGSLGFGDDDVLSVSAWIKVNSIGNQEFIIDESNSTTYGGGLSMRVKTDGTVRFWNQDANYAVDSNTVLQTGKWYHVVGVYNGTDNLIYIDGKLDNTASVGSQSTRTTRDAQVGHSELLGGYFNGSIDDIAVFSRVLSSSEISNLNIRQGTVTSKQIDHPLDNFSSLKLTKTRANQEYDYYALRYYFDDGSGSTVTDYGNNNLNGTLENGALWKTDGRFGNAIYFDGSDDYVSVTDSDALNITNAITLGAWINSDAIADHSVVRRIISKDGSYALQYDSSTAAYQATLVFYNGSTWIGCGDTYTLPDHEWIYLVGVFNGTHIIDYANGKEIKNCDVGTQTIAKSTNTPAIGGEPAHTQWFNGTIDNVIILNKSISADEVNKLYSNVVVNVIDANNGSDVLISNAQDNEDLSSLTDDIKLVGYVNEEEGIDYWAVDPDYHNYVYAPKKIVARMWNR